MLIKKFFQKIGAVLGFIFFLFLLFYLVLFGNEDDANKFWTFKELPKDL